GSTSTISTSTGVSIGRDARAARRRPLACRPGTVLPRPGPFDDHPRTGGPVKRYLLAGHSTPDDYATPIPDMQDRVEAVARFNDDLMASGSWVFAGGLMPADTATVVTSTSGDVVMTDGPFTETKEQIGGFWILDAPDLDAALAWAARASEACANPV